MMHQKEVVEELVLHNVKPDGEFATRKEQEPMTSPKWVKRFKGKNGIVFWLCTNNHPDLVVDTSVRAGTSLT